MRVDSCTTSGARSARGQLAGLRVAEPLRELAGHHDAQQLVELAAADRVARVAAGAHRVPDRLAVVGRVEPDDVAARHHDAAHRAVRQAQDALDHLVLGGVEDAGVRAFRDHRADFLLADRRVVFFGSPSSAHDELGHVPQHPDQRRAQERERFHRPRERRGDFLGVGQRPALGHQLADHDGQEGDADHDDAVGRRVEVLRDRREAASKPAQPGGERRAKRAPL